MYLKTQDIKKGHRLQDIKATKTRISVGLNKGMGNKVSSGTKQYLTAAYRSTRGTRRKRVKNSTKVQEVYYVEQVLRLRKAPNYTGTKWYRGGTENMAGTHRYLYTGTYIGTYIYPDIHI